MGSITLNYLLSTRRHCEIYTLASDKTKAVGSSQIFSPPSTFGSVQLDVILLTIKESLRGSAEAFGYIYNEWGGQEAESRLIMLADWGDE